MRDDAPGAILHTDKPYNLPPKLGAILHTDKPYNLPPKLFEKPGAVYGPNPKPDMVNLPKHYDGFAIEPYRFIMENDLPFVVGCIIKYVCRYEGKNGVEDVKKAERMCRMLVKQLEGDPDFWKREKVTYEVV
jgi:hypothetical protein